MTLQDIKQLYNYNTWANKRLFDAASQVSAGQYLEDMKSSHGGIHGTLVHIVAAQKIWLSRWVGKPDTKLVQATEVPSYAELKTLWESVDAATHQFIESISDSKLHETVSMSTTKGDTFTHTFSQMMVHLVNHSSYHRGQVASLIRQLGIKPPSTDMILFYREKSS